ncbi:hypothetical protein [Streptomyces viridosporus]
MKGEINLHSSVETWLLKPAQEDPLSADLVHLAAADEAGKDGNA